ncbi:MAG: acyl-CoA synthetase [Halioglobus sp.]
MEQSPVVVARAQNFGENTAIRWGDQAISYADILKQSSIIATRLLENCEDLSEEPILFLAPAGSTYIALLWGIWRAGGIAVPLNVHATLPEMQHCAETVGANVILVSDALEEQALALTNRCRLQAIFVDELLNTEPTSAVDEVDKSFPHLKADRRALIIFTSGTTSKPKGVVTTHTNIESQITALTNSWGWQDEDRIPLFLPLHHVHGLINILSCALWVGAEVEVFSGAFDQQLVLQGVVDQRWTLFMAVPTIYIRLIAAIDDASEDLSRQYCHGFKSMRLMVSGSAALPASVYGRWEELTGQQLLERYGMTEIGMALSNPLEGERRPSTVGVPLPGVKLRLVSEDGSVVANASEVEGLSGEIQVIGPSVFLEYWNDRDATSEAFAEDGWFRTGDLAVREDGYYRILGRMSVDIIKSGGYKLSALEIESVLLDHPKIRECAVIGLPEKVWGEQVAAVVVLHEVGELTLPILSAWAEKRISSYKLPRSLYVIDSLPRNAMGKVLKSELIALFQ